MSGLDCADYVGISNLLNLGRRSPFNTNTIPRGIVITDEIHTQETAAGGGHVLSNKN